MSASPPIATRSLRRTATNQTAQKERNASFHYCWRLGRALAGHLLRNQPHAVERALHAGLSRLVILERASLVRQYAAVRPAGPSPITNSSASTVMVQLSWGFCQPDFGPRGRKANSAWPLWSKVSARLSRQVTRVAIASKASRASSGWGACA